MVILCIRNIRNKYINEIINHREGEGGPFSINHGCDELFVPTGSLMVEYSL